MKLIENNLDRFIKKKTINEEKHDRLNHWKRKKRK